MDKNAIKKFAVWARRDLIERVAQKAAGYGITADEIIPADADSIHGELLSAAEKRQRKALITEINEKGYEQVIEEVAYTWFNRFIALRFMEVNGYLPSHIRVFTNDSGAFQPQILAEATHLDFDGIDMERVYAMKQDNKDEELFKYLLILQCNTLNAMLPEMFEKIEDYTEMLLPDYLLREGSVIEQMIALIPEDDWSEQVQIIGWLYQYYNSEKKDAVFEAMKKNVKVSKDNIPAATQLFTPDWIVRYMVENSLGRLWVDGHADTSARAEWKYYLDEAEQTPEVQAQLTEIRDGRKNLTPEQIRFIDPCMGSGHILVYAFDVLMQIYVSCGYSERDAAHSIVQHNLWGLDLDKRAYQLAYFALMMKARQYDRRFLTRGIKPNLSHFQDLPQLNYALLDEPIRSFVQQFENADTYGSLISVQPIDGIDEAVDAFGSSLELSFTQLEHFMQLYKILSQRYDVVCTNPPYMGSSGMNMVLSDYVKVNYPNSKSDLYAVFIEKILEMAEDNGICGLMTSYTWMFIASYFQFRKMVLENSAISSLVQPEYHSFFESANVPICTFILRKGVSDFSGVYIKLQDFYGADKQANYYLEAINNRNCNYRYLFTQRDFFKIPSVSLAYWVSDGFIHSFEIGKKLGEMFRVSEGIKTGDNERFLRFWNEVDITKFSRGTDKTGFKWYPHHKGGDFRKWYGNLLWVVNWENDGFEIKGSKNSGLQGKDIYFLSILSWSKISTRGNPIRFYKSNVLFDSMAPAMHSDNMDVMEYTLGLLNSSVTFSILNVLNPTLALQVGDMRSMPIVFDLSKKDIVKNIVNANMEISKSDWDSFETSWDFKRHPLI